MSIGIRDNFKKGSIEILLLSLLAEEDMYGYQLSNLIAERSNQILTVPEGSLYPSLYKMLENKYISDERRLVGKRMTRVYYHIEESGIERLKLLKQEYTIVQQGIQSVFDNNKLQGGDIK